MRSLKPLVILLIFSGCGLISKESVYEGIRSQEKIKSDTKIPSPSNMPPYDQYQNERDKLKAPNSN